MAEFLEFCREHPWEAVLILYAVASASAIFGWIISSLFANHRIQDILAEMHNPANVSKRIERKK